MQQGLCHDWAIIGAGVRPADEIQRQRLQDQNYLTTLIELDPSGKLVEIVGSMIGFAKVESSNSALIQQMADPQIRIVSLTVTEGGYFLNPSTGKFNPNSPDVQYDVTHPNEPKTAFGSIIAALKIRRDQGIAPFTCMSCDNLQGNGDIFKQTISELAALIDPELSQWIIANCTFPNSMVDCIVPVTGPKEIALAKTYDIEDAAPVTHENFRQWVIEDNFCAGRPQWEHVGVTFTQDIHSYEAMKIRILNGGHQVIANPGEVLGIDYISQCMQHPEIGELFRKVASTEVVPHVQPVPGMTPLSYVDLINRRFSNPEIVDTVRRVAFDGSSRHTGFILPVLRDALHQEKPYQGLTLSQAIWARMCEGTRENGSVIEPNDPYWAELNPVAKSAKNDPLIWLKQKHIYGELVENEKFCQSFSFWFNKLWTDGLVLTIQHYLQKNNL
jgi:mannitol 2-dehydrogenase